MAAEYKQSTTYMRIKQVCTTMHPHKRWNTILGDHHLQFNAPLSCASFFLQLRFKVFSVSLDQEAGRTGMAETSSEGGPFQGCEGVWVSRISCS